MGYVVWHKHLHLAQKAVPDSCCLEAKEKCGHDIFGDLMISDRKLTEAVKRIHVHGCARAVKSALKVRPHVNNRKWPAKVKINYPTLQQV